jgi:hypothetical protein
VVTPGLAGHICGQCIERAPNRFGHLLCAAGMHHRIGHAAHQILAEADLWIHRAARGGDLARFEIAQMRRDRGRADVHGQAEDPVMQAGPDADNLRVPVHGDSDFPLSLAQYRLQCL